MRLLTTIVVVFAVIGCAQKRKTTPSYEGKPLRYWQRQAESEDPAKRQAAAEALGKIGPNALPTLVKMRNDRERRVRARSRLKLWAWALKPCLS